MSQPVLVVRAGPVGLTLALALRQQDIAVRLVDRAPQPGYRAGWTYLIRPDAYLCSCAPSAEQERLLAAWEAWR